jgi:hypothetical protein
MPAAGLSREGEDSSPVADFGAAFRTWRARHLKMTSHVLEPSKGFAGYLPSLNSSRDRRDRRRRNPNLQRAKVAVPVLVEIPTSSSGSESTPIAPEMVGPALNTVQQAFGEVPDKAKQTHRNDPSNVNQVLLCGSPTD